MKTFAKAVLSAAALLAFGAAHAYTIDFESVDTTNAPFAPLLASGDYVTQGGFFVNGQTADGSYGLVGSLESGADANSCLDQKCPLGNLSNFYGSVNDGLVHIGALDGSVVTLTGFDAAFVGPAGLVLGANTAAYLAIEGDRADGTYAVGIVPLFGTGSGNTTSFSSFLTSDLSYIGGDGTVDQDVTDIYAYAYYCNQTTGSCRAFNSDRGQFALDNITFDTPTVAVPEPSEWMLMALGLAAVGGALRRRRSV